MTGVLIKRGEKTTYRRRPWDDGPKGQSATSTNQGAPRIAGTSFLVPLERARPTNTLILDFWPLGYERIHLWCFIPPSSTAQNNNSHTIRTQCDSVIRITAIIKNGKLMFLLCPGILLIQCLHYIPILQKKKKDRQIKRAQSRSSHQTGKEVWVTWRSWGLRAQAVQNIYINTGDTCFLLITKIYPKVINRDSVDPLPKFFVLSSFEWFAKLSFEICLWFHPEILPHMLLWQVK
jgi:hypothetical protein